MFGGVFCVMGARTEVGSSAVDREWMMEWLLVAQSTGGGEVEARLRRNKCARCWLWMQVHLAGNAKWDRLDLPWLSMLAFLDRVSQVL